jgi:TPR repeat protein
MNINIDAIAAYAYLFGDHTRWNVKEAKRIFEELSLRGSNKAQLGLAFLHSSGVGVANSSQSRALVYFTFAALGGNPLAQMALVRTAAQSINQSIYSHHKTTYIYNNMYEYA